MWWWKTRNSLCRGTCLFQRIPHQGTSNKALLSVDWSKEDEVSSRSALQQLGFFFPFPSSLFLLLNDNESTEAENSFLFWFLFFSPVEVTAHWYEANSYKNLSLKGFRFIFFSNEAFFYSFKVGVFWLLIFFLIKGFNPSIFILHLSHCSMLQKLAN